MLELLQEPVTRIRCGLQRPSALTSSPQEMKYHGPFDECLERIELGQVSPLELTPQLMQLETAHRLRCPSTSLDLEERPFYSECPERASSTSLRYGTVKSLCSAHTPTAPNRLRATTSGRSILRWPSQTQSKRSVYFPPLIASTSMSRPSHM